MDSIDADSAAVPGRPAAAEGAAPLRRWPMLGRLEKTAIGTRGAGGAISVRRREPAGGLLFGPFWRLPGGHYRLSFRCRAGKPYLRSQPVLGVEVIALNRNQQAWRDFTAEELAAEPGVLDFEVPPVLSLEAGEEARFEFRFFHLGNADLTIDAVDLHQLDDAEIRPPTRPEWRLLGRLRKTAIGRRGTDGAAIARRSQSAGLWLHGVWPYLRLPEGRHRLCLRCRAGTPRHASQPVVGVEIIGYSRWNRPWWRRRKTWFAPTARDRVRLAWRDFTAAELHAGSGSLDFDVPLELALESGEDAPFEFRIFHLGNGALTIDGVDLHRLDEDAVEPAVKRRWRMLGRLRRDAGGTRDGDRVAVRREQPAGPLLTGGRVTLFLPVGHYRLWFRCRAGVPRDAAAAVLTARIGVRRRASRGGWRAWLPVAAAAPTLARREFTAADLADGTGAIDFAMPAGSADADDAPCEIAFAHLGNADLAIEAVEVQETAAADASTRLAPRRPRAATLRNVIVVGNCQAETIRQGFHRAPPLHSRFRAKYHFVGLQKNLHTAARQELQECDLLLVQDIRDWDAYPLREFIPDGIEIIKFPLLHLASLWPFDHYNGPGDSEAYRREWPNLTFLYHDGLLARLRQEIPDKERRLRAYRSLEIAGIVNYVRLHDFEKRRLLALDRQFGCEIGRFILANFQTRQLFYTTNHPNRQLVTMLMQHLMKCLGIGEEFPHVEALDHLKRLQVPVHPKVAADLGAKWADENTRYIYQGTPITWEAYTRNYIDHYG